MLPALSIRQPWAWLVVNGFKPVENRDWATPFRGRLLIHAGQTMSRRYYADVRDSLEQDGLLPATFPLYDELERGGLVGRARMVDCLPRSDSPWYIEGSHAFAMTDAEPQPFVPWKGKLGFFNVPSAAVSGWSPWRTER